ncbi:MAG TPA: SDR family NAD(P)-dependent oxidoreductase [Aggregatilineales bacterium]|nr:SDR family NAD(P)-dependent oxidoreductase [Aggregatilineales bacterium]
MSEGQVVLITGASSGIGQATAEILADAGLRVYGTSRHPDQATAKGFTLLPLDVTDSASISACVAAVMEQAGRIDVLINNAGYAGPFGASEELSPEQLRQVFETNFFGVVSMTNAVLPNMRRQGSGTIINIGSASGVAATPFSSAYCSSKFALEGYSESLRLEVAPLGIRVHLLEPGFYHTKIDQTYAPPVHPLPVYERRRAQIEMLARIALMHGRDPRQVGEAILRLIRQPSTAFRIPLGSDAQSSSLLKRFVPFRLFEILEGWMLSGEGVDPSADDETRMKQLGMRGLLVDGTAMDAAQPVIALGLLGTGLWMVSRLFHRSR